MAFFTITVAPGLDKSDHRRAVRIGPRAVAARREADELMTQAGFVEVDAQDVTDDFERTARAWHREYEENERELREVLGADYDELRANRVEMIEGVEQGLLRRTLVVGTAPEE